MPLSPLNLSSVTSPQPQTLCQTPISSPYRVVCCYPDVDALIRGAAARARRMVAFTCPRDRWYVRASVALENSWYRLRQDEFRAFVHSPERMGSVLESAGFVRAARQATPQWAVDLYSRQD